MKINRHVIYLIVAILVIIGCEELEVPETDQFVVEAFITAGEQVQDIIIKQTAALDAESPSGLPITDAEVIISNNGQEVMLTYDELTGKYTDPSNELAIVVGDEYQIEVNRGEVSATGTTIVPERPTGLALSDDVLVIPTLSLSLELREEIQDLFDEVTIALTWNSEPGQSYFVVIENQVDSIESILPDGVPEESLELLSSFRFISAPSEATSFEIIAVALETYGPHVAKVYSVNQEYVDLFNSATQDSRDLNEPPSNLTNALGIFSAFAVDSIAFELRRE